MAFESIQFKYTPPPTVSAAIPAAQAAVPVSLATGGSLANSGNATASASAAGKLIARLADLLDTNQYLQQVILAMSTGLGIEFDPSVDPETARALQTIYSNLPVPTSLTVSMYNRMLDAKMTALQIESGLGTGTAYETNPFQASAVTQINQTIESGLVNSGQSQYQTALLLGPLKGDAVLFNNMTAQLSQYPVIASPGTPSIATNNPNQISILGQDVSPALASTMNSSLDSFQSSYASVSRARALGSAMKSEHVQLLMNDVGKEMHHPVMAGIDEARRRANQNEGQNPSQEGSEHLDACRCLLVWNGQGIHLPECGRFRFDDGRIDVPLLAERIDLGRCFVAQGEVRR